MRRRSLSRANDVDQCRYFAATYFGPMVSEDNREIQEEIERVQRLLRVTMDPPTLKVLIARLEELKAKLASIETRR